MKNSTKTANQDFDCHVAKTALHSGAALLAYSFAWLIIAPIQKQILPEMFTLVSLFYLPFGIKIISGFFEGYRSMLYLAPGVVISFLLFLEMPFSNPKTYMTILISYATAPTVFKLLDWLKADGARELSASQAWRTLVLGGAISSVLVSFLVHGVWHETINPDVLFQSMLRFIIGDMLGLTAVLTVLIAVFRVRRQTNISRRRRECTRSN